jgi:AcrR family transcriptional regulator
MASPPGARDRILDAAYDLFSQHGIRGVGIDAIVARSGVARMTLYRHFSSKQALALAYLEQREQRWTQEWLEQEVMRRSDDPAERLLAIFDVFDTWFRRADFEGCAFINVMLEGEGEDDPVQQASTRYLSNIRSFLKRLAREAGIRNPDDFARKWHILMKGSIVSAGEGDVRAAQRARDVGRLLLTDALSDAR